MVLSFLTWLQIVCSSVSSETYCVTCAPIGTTTINHNVTDTYRSVTQWGREDPGYCGYPGTEKEHNVPYL